MQTLRVPEHPLLDVAAFVCRLDRVLSEASTPPTITRFAASDAPAPVASSDIVRTAVRDLLRHGGFKPAGRSKPASEYLVRAAAENQFPAINALVDACNVVSLHSGLPISLVDLARVDGDLSIQIAPAATTYVFNPSGQVIDASGLLCLYDAAGPTGTPVKDAQRTKTHDGTRDAIIIVWGTNALPGHTAATTAWYRALCAEIAGATTEDVALARP
jgi:DNA/RNA-binding domain of Phe-tRNA-synthetase-like protein